MAGKALLGQFSARTGPVSRAMRSAPAGGDAAGALRDAGRRRALRGDRLWGRQKLAFLRSPLPFRRGIPSHDALNDVINAHAPDLFGACFPTWVAGPREDEPDIVAVDGKTSRRSRRGEDHPLRVVSAWATRQRLVLGQQAVGGKPHEITAIPLRLERLHLAGPWSRSTPWAARPGSRRPSSTAATTISSP
jgi:hypothetical protein